MSVLYYLKELCLRYKWIIGAILMVHLVAYGATILVDLTVQNNATINGALTMGGNITISSGTVDGRDVSTDGATLDNLDSTIGLGGLTTNEVDQLKNIGAITITSGQWVNVSNMDQDVATTDIPTFNGALFDDAIVIDEIATPSNPSASTDKLYFKSGGGLFSLNSSGVEVEFTTGGSGATANKSYVLENLGHDTSVGSSALTIALKQANGTADPTGVNPVKIGFRSSTVTSGGFNVRAVTTTLEIVVPSGATLNHADGADGFIYIYSLDNAGTVELAVSSVTKDESSVQTSVTIGTGSDGTDLYSTTGRVDVPIRLISRVKSNQVTAGTWDLDMTENTPGEQLFTDTNNKIDKRVKQAGTITEDIRKCSFLITCQGSSTIGSQTGDCLASIGNVSAGACVLTFTDDIASSIACQANQNSANPDQNIGFHTFNAGADQISIDCDVSATGTDCTIHASYVNCTYEAQGL